MLSLPALLRRVAPPATLALAAACGSDATADRARVDLARGFRPATDAPAETEWLPALGSDEPLTIRRDPAGGSGFWVRTRVRRGEWRASPYPRTMRFRYPIEPGGAPPPSAPGGEPRPAFRLTAPGREFESVPLSADVDRSDPRPGEVTTARRNLFLVLGPDGLPPEEARFEVWVDRGRDDGGTWRLTVGNYTAPGIPVWSGHAETVRTRVPPGSSLRFATTGHASLPDYFDQSERLVYRIELDGEPLFEHEQRLGDETQAETHEVPLPADGLADARLTFRVEGPAAVAAFLAPVLGPADVAPRGTSERRAADPRPDVILFLADTFRADNLALYGGELGLTPNLDRFAEECVAFERAWSVSAWTLPAQSTMVSGLFPRQHGVIERSRRIADGVVTVAERLAEAGYRTGAVTGGGYLSPAFGFDQGFSWFDQSWVRWDVEDSTDDVEDFLDLDDGRPVFLFVQTYRAHGPYVVRDETARRFEGELRLDREWGELSRGIDAASEDWDQGDPFSPELRRAVTDMRDLYLGAVHDLDRGFGVFLGMLERRGLGSAFLLFTSDHGEAFGEHDNLMHGTGVWDELTRVPLLVRGPGLEPRRVPWSATLVDVARTLADMAGVEPAPDWRGASLLRLEEDRPAFLFDCALGGRNHRAAVVDGPRKLLIADEDEAIAEGRALGLYDLSDDPAERENRLGPSTWTDEDRAWLRRALAAVRRPVVEAATATLDADAAEAMGALGYAGDD